jgi:hypothetical protein
MAQQWWRGKLAADAATMPLQRPRAEAACLRLQKPAAFDQHVAFCFRMCCQAIWSAAIGRAILLLCRACVARRTFRRRLPQPRSPAPTDINMVPPSFARFEHDAALEDAAIVFASGDSVAAETVSRP